MATHLRIVLAQLNPIVGDLTGNLNKHLVAAKEAASAQADLIIFPELSLTGYPPEDLLLRPAFIAEAEQTLASFAKQAPSLFCIIGHPHHTKGRLYNACSVFHNGQLIARYHKQCLPNYGVFDEHRYFATGNTACVFTLNEVKIGVLICEDIWEKTVLPQTVALGAQLIVIPNASPFETDKHQRRLQLLKHHAKTQHLPLLYCNLVGGQDELVFDGDSMIVDQHGALTHHAGLFTETSLSVDIKVERKELSILKSVFTLPTTMACIYQALVLGVRDYIRKNHFSDVIIGLSGGIDSALTLAIAVDALGSQHVKTLFMPSRYSADISLEDASMLANNLSVTLDTISIEPTYQAFLASLAPIFMDEKPDITEENIQARCRAILLMALSNKYGCLVLTTGNRSELAVGYCTLYGDMAGAFAPLKDVSKTMVYELVHYRNQLKHVIPERIITRPPSAELAPNQKDEDSLPPYPVLDDILARYINHGQSIHDIITAGHPKTVVEKIIRLVQRSEYKRKQSTLGPHINHQSFGKDWRYPITNGFKG